MSGFVLLLITYAVYELFNRRKNSEKQQLILEEDFKPFLEGLNLDNEKKVRKLWLISFFMVLGLRLLVILLTYFESIFNEISEETGLILLIGLFFSALALVCWTWITYHCSYRKRGTAWLMWTMIIMPLREIVSIKHSGLNYPMEWDLFEWVISITFIGIDLFFWINCLRLHRVNSARKSKRSSKITDPISKLTKEQSIALNQN